MPRSLHPFQDQVFPRNQVAFLISVPLSANKTHTYNAGLFPNPQLYDTVGKCSGNCTTGEGTPMSILHTESRGVHIACNDLSKLKL